MKRGLLGATLACTLALTGATTAGATTAGAATATAATGGGVDDPSCRPSAAHPDPVVFLHGLGATKNEDLNFLQADIARQGYCTYGVTYGAYPQFPFAGGLRPIADSAAEIAAFTGTVRAETGADKVDIVGHSEGGFQSLYVTKTQGIAEHVGRVVAIAPPTHGTSFGGLVKLAYLFGQGGRDATGTVLRTVGCAACDDLTTGGAAVATLNDGPVAQPGVDYTVITSRHDELVTPPETAFVRGPGVTNEYVQDTCPLDPVGHIGEAYDRNVWHLVGNALDPGNEQPFTCTVGAPF